MSWEAKTLHPAKVAIRKAAALDGAARRRDVLPPARLRCACGRMVSPVMMADLATVAKAGRLALGQKGDATACCDACIDRARKRGLSREKLARILGAPADVVARARAKDRLALERGES